MKKMNYTFYEFDAVACGEEENQIPKRAFTELKALAAPRSIEEVETVSEDTPEIGRCLSLGVKGGREVIRFENYVGTIALPCGVSIEILPKISKERNIALSRSMVIEMLKAGGNLPYKSFRNANLGTDNLNLLEIYIRLFLDELYLLSRKGFRAGYVAQEANEFFLRGKLLLKEQIRKNCVHREKFYVGYDVFNFNRAENKIIKTTLEYIRMFSRNEANLRDIRRFLLLLDEIDRSDNPASDFKKCAQDRSAKDYAPILRLCKVFLRKQGFTMYGGRNHVIALLFPMERLFEKFIAQQMRGCAMKYGWKLREQDVSLSLFDGRQFTLRPDILLVRDGRKMIVDTKWKRLDAGKANYGISQADMYQMYAYHTRYHDVSQVILFYPMYEAISIDDYLIREKDIRVSIRFFDLNGYIHGGKPFQDCIYPQTFFGGAEK